MISNKQEELFKFKQFSVRQENCSMKVGTDGVLLGAWAEVADAASILDIGTGTGLIALMMAQRNSSAIVDAVEIDEHACQQATENMQASPWADRLSAVHSAVQDFAKGSNTTYDLIVSNPPFFSGGTFSANQDRNSVRHTVKLPNGDLLNAARTLLSKKGRFCVILPHLEGLRFEELATRYKLYCTRKTEVFPKKDKRVERLLLQFEHEDKSTSEDSIVVENEQRHDYTEAYIALTKDFYLKM